MREEAPFYAALGCWFLGVLLSLGVIAALIVILVKVLEHNHLI